MDKIEIIRQMVDKNPGDALTWYLLGTEYLDQSMESEALQAFSESLKYCDQDLRGKVLEQLARLSGRSTAGGEAPFKGDVAASELDNADQGMEDEEEDEEIIEDGQNNVVALRVIGGGRKHNSKNQVDSAHKVITFHDVGGLENLKEVIRMKIIKPFVNPGLFERFKKRSGGGILLYGPPGCGKTYMARATAGECQARFVAVHITDILDPYIGVSEQNIRDVFSTARAQKPCVLFFDEIDAIGFNRARSSSHLLRPMVDQLMTEMEGIDSNTEQILILGATNMPWDVDPAFKRPGRFDRLVFVPPPDEKAREVILGLKLAERPVDKVDLNVLAKRTALFSGADIENVVEVATESVLSEIMKTGTERPIGQKDLLDAIASTQPSTLDWFRTIKNYVKYANQSGLYNDVEKFLSSHKGI